MKKTCRCLYIRSCGTQGKIAERRAVLVLFQKQGARRDLVEEVLPGPVLARLDLESIRVHDVSYLDDDLARHYSDLVLGMNLKDSDDPVDMYCLLEHKSRPARFVGLQLLRYIALRWTECLKNKIFAEGRQPSIIPVVIYQGESNWRVPASFHELAHFPPEDFNAYAPDFVFEFFDIPRISDDRLRELKHKAFLRFYLAMLKSLNSPELKKILPELAEGLFRTLDAETGMDLIAVFFRYIIRHSGVIGKEDIAKIAHRLPRGGEQFYLFDLYGIFGKYSRKVIIRC